MPLQSAVVPRCRMFFRLSSNQDYAARAGDGSLRRVELPTPQWECRGANRPAFAARP